MTSFPHSKILGNELACNTLALLYASSLKFDRWPNNNCKKDIYLLVRDLHRELESKGKRL